jgi:hypothetical protein
MIQGVTPQQIDTIYNAVLEGDAKGAQAGVNAALTREQLHEALQTFTS